MIKDLFELVENFKSYGPKYVCGTQPAGLNNPPPHFLFFSSIFDSISFSQNLIFNLLFFQSFWHNY